MVTKTLKVVDEKEVNIGVKEKQRAEVAKQLSVFLASTYTLYMKTLNYHWNVTGKQFSSLHELFENQYEDLHAAGDEVAERVRALGHFVPATFAEYLKLSAIKEDASMPESADLMIKNLLADNELASQEARKVLDVSEKAEDEVTVDMMVARMAIHEEAAWMLRSTLE